MDRLTIEWRDAAGNESTSQVPIASGYAVDDSDIIGLVNALRAASQATIVGYSVTLKGDVADLTNGAASAGGSFDLVTDKAVLNFRNTSSGEVSRTSVPAPLDTIFEQTGGYQMARVDMENSLVTDIGTAASGGVVVGKSDLALTLFEGWREGTKH